MVKNKEKKKEEPLKYFSENAKNSLEKCVNKYRENLITQTLLLEEMNREETIEQKPEITATHVARAEQTLRLKNNRKKSKVSIFFSITSEFLLLLTGLFFDWEKMIADPKYFGFILILIFLTITFVCLNYIKGEG